MTTRNPISSGLMDTAYERQVADYADHTERFAKQKASETGMPPRCPSAGTGVLRDLPYS